MTSFALQVTVFLLTLIAFGAVFSQPKRGLNQATGILSLTMVWWLSHNLITLTSSTSSHAMTHIKWASIAAGWVPIFAHIIRILIHRKDQSLLHALREGWALLLAGVLVLPICLAPSFITDITWTTSSDGNALANPTYGTMGKIYTLYLIAHTALLISTSIKDRRHLKGLRRIEMDYLIGATLSALLLATFVGLLSNLLLGTAKAVPLANAAAATSMAMIVAYGVTARRIMGMQEGARHLAAALLQLLILIAIFTATYLAYSHLSLGEPKTAPYVAAFALALASLPVQRWILRIEGWLFSRDKQSEAVERLEVIQLILNQGATPKEMLATFEEHVTRLLKIDHIMIYRIQGHNLLQAWPQETSMPSAIKESALITYLQDQPTPLSLERSQRQSDCPLRTQATRELQEKNMALAIPTIDAGQISGYILFSQRPGGHIFTDDQIRFARACSEQIEIGLNNVTLFSKVESAHRYHQALVHHIASGVIAIDPTGHINVYNEKARQLLATQNIKENLNELELSVHDLPEPLTAIYNEALQSTQPPLSEFRLNPKHAQPRLFRCMAATFPVTNHHTPGVVMLLDDLTEMRKLEKSVQEKEELARIGQLAAQMAHEIKNPLQTLRTFFDLYPTRQKDPNFTLRFANLATTETQRINHIVTSLMKYVRHNPPDLKPLLMHDLITKLADIFFFRLQQDPKHIRLELNATQNKIMGDSEQLIIVLDNIISNALQAMQQGEVLLTTFLSDDKKSLHITIKDEGTGITAEDLPHIFKPFFSQKVYGTGLGLVTVKSMIEDHGGTISATSDYGKGTAFNILLPLHHTTPCPL